MTTTIERPETRTQTGQGGRHRECPGCPRCQDPQAQLCQQPHPKFNNRHPVCRACGHCVLRGRHADDAEDLDDHPGFGPGEMGSGMDQPSLN